MLHHKVAIRDEHGKIIKWNGSSIDIEDRKRAEKELRRSEEYLAEAQKLSHTGSFAYSPSTRKTVYWSEELFRIFGLDPQRGIPDYDETRRLVHPDDRDRVSESCLAGFREKVEFSQDYRLLLHDGTLKHLHVIWRPVLDEAGDPIQYVGTAADVTDRKTAEEQLRRNAEELQRSEFYLAEGQRLGHMGSWAFDAGGFYYWSPELFRIHGLDPASKPPSLQEYLDGVHPQDRESMAGLIKGILENASPFDATKRIVRPDGEVRYVRCVGVPLVDNKGLKKYVGSAIDVTEHELLTRELRRREAYLAEAQRLSHTGSWAWNLRDGTLFWSEEIYRIYGFNSQETGPSWEQFLERVHPDDRAQIEQRATIETTRKEWIDSHGDFRIVLPDGTVKHLHSVAHPARDGSGEITEIIGTVMDVTEHQLLTQELRRREAYLAEAQTLSHTGSFGWRPDTGEIVWSDETYRIFEYDRSAKPTIDSVAQLVHPEDRADFKLVIDRASAGAPEFEHAYRLLLPDGRVRHVHALAHVLRDAAGNREFVGAVTDVTERKTAEDKIRRLVEAGILGIFFANVEGEIVEANQAFLQMLQYGRQDLVSGRLHWADLTPAEWRESDERSLAEFLATGVFQTYEKEYFRRDGSRVPVLIGGARVQSTNEGVVFVLDLSEQKRAEGKIREQEAELRQMLDLAPQIIAVYGPNSERLYANRVALDYIGLSLEEWQQASDRDVYFHPDDRKRVLDSFDRAFSSGSVEEMELRLRKADGTYRWFFTRCVPLRDDKGQIKRFYSASIDIDDRKRAEERLHQENVALREEIDKASMFEEIVGNSPALKSVLSRISKVAPSDSTVLITGETGTGKELVARAIHRRSGRASRAFVSVNCAAVPRDLIASELFGHEKGAFTGALQRRIGRFELAEGGTIFLDEVGDLPAETQVALLRVLQEREFERVGSNQLIRADVRVISATNRELEAAIAAGSFRRDLFYRLSVFPIESPPLRERKADIPMLVEYFIDRYARKVGKRIRNVEKSTMQLLSAYSWPGNIRELQNVIERSVILCDGDTISVDPSWLSLESTTAQPRSQPFGKKSAAQEKEAIEAALEKTGGRVSGPAGAAAALEIPASTLESKIRSLGINKFRFKHASH
ncbi:MAG: PAS domain-containing protein [Candidatus Acidiferrales bacterium]